MALRDEPRGLFDLRSRRRPLGRALPHAHLRLRPRGARRLSARRGADPDRWIDAVGSDGPRGGEPQAAGAPRRRNERCGAWRSRAARSARPVDAGAVVCRLRVRDRLRPAVDRARQGAVSAPSGRTRPDRSEHGTFLVQAVSGFVIELFPTASDGAYELAAYRLVFALQASFILLACLVYFRSREPIQAPHGTPGFGICA